MKWYIPKEQAEKMLACSKRFVVVEQQIINGKLQPKITLEQYNNAWIVKFDEVIKEVKFSLKDAWEFVELQIEENNLKPEYL